MQPVFLALNEGTAEVAKTGMEAVIGAMTDVFTLSGTVVDQITKQPILLFCLAAGLVGARWHPHFLQPEERRSRLIFAPAVSLLFSRDCAGVA